MYYGLLFGILLLNFQPTHAQTLGGMDGDIGEDYGAPSCVAIYRNTKCRGRAALVGWDYCDGNKVIERTLECPDGSSTVTENRPGYCRVVGATACKSKTLDPFNCDTGCKGKGYDSGRCGTAAPKCLDNSPDAKLLELGRVGYCICKKGTKEERYPPPDVPAGYSKKGGFESDMDKFFFTQTYTYSTNGRFPLKFGAVSGGLYDETTAATGNAKAIGDVTTTLLAETYKDWKTDAKKFELKGHRHKKTVTQYVFNRIEHTGAKKVMRFAHSVPKLADTARYVSFYGPPTGASRTHYTRMKAYPIPLAGGGTSGEDMWMIMGSTFYMDPPPRKRGMKYRIKFGIDAYGVTPSYTSIPKRGAGWVVNDDAPKWKVPCRVFNTTTGKMQLVPRRSKKSVLLYFYGYITLQSGMGGTTLWLNEAFVKEKGKKEKKLNNGVVESTLASACPTKVGIKSAPIEDVVNGCKPFKVQVVSVAGDAITFTANSDFTVDLGSSSSGGKFYSSSGCSGTAITSVNSDNFIDEDEMTVYYEDSQSGTPELAATDADDELLPESQLACIDTQDCPGISQIVFTEAPGELIAHDACEPVTVQTQDFEGTAVNVGATTAIQIGSNASGVLYTDSACSTAWTTIEITSGNSEASGFYKAKPTTTDEELTVSSSANPSWHDDKHEFSVNGIQQLVWTDTEYEVESSACIPVEITATNGGGEAMAPEVDLNLSLSATTGSFYTDSGCSTSWSSPKILADEESVAGYFKTGAIGADNLTASVTNSGLSISDAEFEMNVTGITQVVCDNCTSTVTSGTCTGFTLETRDGADSAENVSIDTEIFVTGSSDLQSFYSDSSCSTLVSSVTIPNGSSSVSVYVKDLQLNEPTSFYVTVEQDFEVFEHYYSTTTTVVCGNSSVASPETCDDGNSLDDDGCDRHCQTEETGTCGNGIVEFAEACDDNNTAAGDGCSATCTLETTTCGNSDTEHDEQCDDGNTSNGDDCDSSCQLEDPPACGDSFVQVTEDCDDGGNDDGDGCSEECTEELVTEGPNPSDPPGPPGP